MHWEKTMKVSPSSDLGNNQPSMDGPKGSQGCLSTSPNSQHWQCATDDLEIDACLPSHPGNCLSTVKPHRDTLISKNPWWQSRDCASIHTSLKKGSYTKPQTGLHSDDVSEQEVTVTVKPTLPDNRWDPIMGPYRDSGEVLNSEACDSVDCYVSGPQDSGAEFVLFRGNVLPSEQSSDNQPVSVWDSEITPTSPSVCSSQGVPTRQFAAAERAWPRAHRGGAVFAGGSLSTLCIMQQDFSKMSLTIPAQPNHGVFSDTELAPGNAVTVTEKNQDTAGSSEEMEQVTAKRLKCTRGDYPFNLHDLLRSTNDIAQKLAPHHMPASTCHPFRSLSDQDEDGDTILHLALILDQPGAALELLDDPATNANDLSIQNHLGQTALHLAVLLDSAEVARRLVLRGSQVALQDRHGNTPLHLACTRGHQPSVVALTQPPSPEEDRGGLMGRDGAVPFQRIPQDPELRNYEGLTCLHLASEAGHLAVVNYLVQCCGCDINAHEYRAGETALHRAVRDGDIELVRYLLSFEELEVNARRYDGTTPLQLASRVSACQEQIVELLVEKGAIADAEDPEEVINDNLNLICMDTDFEYDDFRIGGSFVT